MNPVDRRTSSGRLDRADAGQQQQQQQHHHHHHATASVRLRRTRSLLPLHSSTAAPPAGSSFTCPSPYHPSSQGEGRKSGNNSNKEGFWTWIFKPQKWSLLCLLLLILSVATTCSFVMHSLLFVRHDADHPNGEGEGSPRVRRGPSSPSLSFLSFGSASATVGGDRKRNYSWAPPLSLGASPGAGRAGAAPRWFAPRVLYLEAASADADAVGAPQVLWSLESQYYDPDRNLSTADRNHMDNNNDLFLTPPTDGQEQGATIVVTSNSTDAGSVPDAPDAASHSDYSTDRADDCSPMAPWQVESFPNCNMFHELDWRQSIRDGAMSVLGRGWFRTTWRFNATSPERAARAATTTHVPLVLKTLRMEREFLAEYYELHRRDATAMERLTWSEFVVDIYGYCGQSAFNEMADFPVAEVRDLEKLNRRLRRRRGPEIERIKLQLAASVAQGVADIHSIDGPHRATMVHYDLNPRNIALFSRARPKINDFNIAEFLTYDPTTNATCGFPNRMHQPWWRAPEEVDPNATAMLDEKVDVYALCNILFSIYTTHAPRGKMKDYRMEGVRELVLAGVPPDVPDDVTPSPITDVFETIFSRCYAKDPAERGTAQEITDMLVNELYRRLGKSKKTKTSPSTKAKDSTTKASAEKAGASKGQMDRPSSPDAAESVAVKVEPVGGDNATNDDDDSADTTADAAERTR